MASKHESKVDFWLTDDGLVLLEAWARDGLTQTDLCEKMGITRNTLFVWRKNYEEIDRALNTSKEIVDYKVENALLKAALGYKTKEIKVTIGKKLFNGETVEMLKETTTKEIAPNVTACMAWLNNRKHDQWKRNRDKVLELDEEDNNISITIVRGPKGDDLGENVNNEVNFRPKTKEEINDENEEKARKQKEKELKEEEEWEAMNSPVEDDDEDLSCWDEWDENDV